MPRHKKVPTDGVPRCEVCGIGIAPCWKGKEALRIYRVTGEYARAREKVEQKELPPVVGDR